ncbi:hypothetical protein SprV_0902752900 [Sparganum proliferum]
MENLAHTANTIEDVKVKLDILYESRQGHGCCCGSTPTPAPHGPVFQRMGTLEGLDEFTNAILDPKFREKAISYLTANGGDTLSAFADRTFNILFDDRITLNLTFYGRPQWKRAFFGSKPYGLVVDPFSVWNAAHNCDQHQLEKTFRAAFRKAYDRLHERGYRLSSSQYPDDDGRYQSSPGPAGPLAQP